MVPSARTSTKSRTRRSRRLAMRGVPRDRSAIRQGPLGVDRDPEDAGRPDDDGLELVDVVEVEPSDEAEPVPERAGHQPGAGGGADQGEPGQVEPDAPGRRALADEDVELEVLHGRIEDLLHRAVQPVDLVDEEDVALLEVGEQGGQVARTGPAPGPEVIRRPTPISAATMPASEVLPSPGGPANSRWSAGWSRLTRRLDDDLEVLGELSLPDELVQGARAQPGLVGLLGGSGHRIDRPDAAVRRVSDGPAVVPGRGASTSRPGVGRHRLPRQLPQGRAHHLLDRAVVRRPTSSAPRISSGP